MPEVKQEEKPAQTTPKLIDDIRKIDAELYEKRKKELQDMEERVDKKVKELTGAVDEYRREGRAFAGLQKQANAKPSDEEYASKLLKGEVNPLAEDGFI